MAFEIINIPANQWTFITDISVDFQVTGNREVYWKYSEIEPIGIPPSGEAAFYAINTQVYTTNKDNGCVWVYSRSPINVVIGPKTVSNTRNISKYGAKLTAPLNQILASTTVAVATIKDSYDIIVVNASGISVGDYIILFSQVIDNVYFGFVQAIVGNTLTVNVPITDVFPIGSNVDATTIFMNVAGSKVSPQIYRLRGPGGVQNLDDIVIGNRFMWQMITENPINFQNFGDLPALTNGFVIRELSEGQERHIFTVQTNADVAELAYDFRVLEATNPAQGVNGFVARLTFGGDEKIGSAIEMSPVEDIIATVQDDLSTIVLFTITPQGYFLRP
jgi:hypothetical protein